MIRVGAPFAHVWLKDVVSHASPAGAAALTAFSNMLGVYALARFFPAEFILVPIGMAMIVIGAFYCAVEDDLRRAGAYAMTAQSGVCVALIGEGSPFALAAAACCAFTAIFSFMALQMSLGGFVDRLGGVQIAALRGIARKMPVSAALVFLSGLAVAGAPGFASFASHVLALDAMSTWEQRGVWALTSALSGVVVISLALRPMLAAAAAAPRASELREARYAFLLGAVLSVFFCIAIGLAPRWLYGLLRSGLSFEPYETGFVADQLQILGLAGAAYLGLRATGAAPIAPAGRRLLDVDAFYAGPLAGAARWLGVIALRLQGAVEAWMARAAAGMGEMAAKGLEACDKPYRPLLGASGAWVALALVLLAALVAQRLPG
jgi:formate hydrogenlyase subunit 3/multisubunit Na+/H+ antiporter MnhD subunit